MDGKGRELAILVAVPVIFAATGFLAGAPAATMVTGAALVAGAVLAVWLFDRR